MIEKLGYEKLMEDNNLKLSDLNDEARIGIKSITDVKKAIAKVGHDTEGVKATKEDYDNLHSCCQYERLETKK